MSRHHDPGHSRRQHRAEVSEAFALITLKDDHLPASHRARVVDISQDGVGLVGFPYAVVDRQYDLQLLLPGQDAFYATAQVRSQRMDEHSVFHTGLKFTRLADDIRAALKPLNFEVSAYAALLEDRLTEVEQAAAVNDSTVINTHRQPVLVLHRERSAVVNTNQALNGSHCFVNAYSPDTLGAIHMVRRLNPAAVVLGDADDLPDPLYSPSVIESAVIMHRIHPSVAFVCTSVKQRNALHEQTPDATILGIAQMPFVPGSLKSMMACFTPVVAPTKHSAYKL